jgi:hypothetical protein
MMPMALLVFFRKIQDDPTEIRYEFGTKRGRLDQRLTINKQTWAFQDQNGRKRGTVHDTAARILGQVRTEGTWPENGVIQA